MTLICDIDNVLLPWGDEESEFTDWRKEKKQKHFSEWSPSQLKLIEDNFSDIRWLTTWIDGNAANRIFSKVTKFGPWSIANDSLDEVVDYPVFPINPWVRDRGIPCDRFPEAINDALHTASWWKLNTVAALLQADALPGWVTWVDDEINSLRTEIRVVLEYFNTVDRFDLISPNHHWTKTSILGAAEKANGWNQS